MDKHWFKLQKKQTSTVLRKVRLLKLKASKYEVRHTSTKVTKRYAAVLLWSPNIGIPSNARVWNFSVKVDSKFLEINPTCKLD